MTDTETPMPAASALRELRTRAGLSLREAAAALDMPVTSYANYEHRYRKAALPIEFVRKISTLLIGKGSPPITIPEVMALAGIKVTTSLMPAPGDNVFDAVARDSLLGPPNTLIMPQHSEPLGRTLEREAMPRDVPVFGTVAAASDGRGAFIMPTGGPVDYVRRPPGIQSNRAAFAMYVENDSMSPRYEAGDLVYLDPNRPPVIGSDVCVERKMADGSATEAYIKRLVRRSATYIRLQQFNPPDTFDLPVSEVVRMVRVLSLSELLGL